MTIGTPKVGTPAYWSTGTGTAAWPATIAAGDFVVVNICGSDSGTDKREPVDAVANGWKVWKKTYSTHTWYMESVSQAYLDANPSGIPCKGRIVFVEAIAGVGAAGGAAGVGGADGGVHGWVSFAVTV